MVTESRNPPVNGEPREDDSRGSSVFGTELLPGSVDELKQASLATSPKGGSEQAATRLARHVPQATA